MILITRKEAQEILGITNQSSFRFKMAIEGIKPKEKNVVNGRLYYFYDEEEIKKIKEV